MLSMSYIFEFGDEILAGQMQEPQGPTADEQIERSHLNDKAFNFNGADLENEKQRLMNNIGHVGVYGGRYLPAGEYSSAGLPNVNKPFPGHDGVPETFGLGVRAAYPEYHQMTGNELVDNQPKYYPQSISPAMFGVAPAAKDAYIGAGLRNAFKNIP